MIQHDDNVYSIEQKQMRGLKRLNIGFVFCLSIKLSITFEKIK